jgi:hypothetical protein
MPEKAFKDVPGKEPIALPPSTMARGPISRDVITGRFTDET